MCIGKSKIICRAIIEVAIVEVLTIAGFEVFDAFLDFDEGTLVDC